MRGRDNHRDHDYDCDDHRYGALGALVTVIAALEPVYTDLTHQMRERAGL